MEPGALLDNETDRKIKLRSLSLNTNSITNGAYYLHTVTHTLHTVTQHRRIPCVRDPPGASGSQRLREPPDPTRRKTN